MPLSSEALTFALDDARNRHQALVNLILFIDQQALTLLNVYMTLGLAAVAGATAGFAGQLTFVPIAVAVALSGAVVMLVIGAAFCFQAMRSSTISLPGRDAEFWLWAIKGGDVEAAAKEYLGNLTSMTALNRGLNESAGRALGYAKLCGVGTPIAALLNGGLAVVLGS